jgi:hypothetical protein
MAADVGRSRQEQLKNHTDNAWVQIPLLRAISYFYNEICGCAPLEPSRLVAAETSMDGNRDRICPYAPAHSGLRL